MFGKWFPPRSLERFCHLIWCNAPCTTTRISYGPPCLFCITITLFPSLNFHLLGDFPRTMYVCVYSSHIPTFGELQLYFSFYFSLVWYFCVIQQCTPLPNSKIWGDLNGSNLKIFVLPKWICNARPIQDGIDNNCLLIGRGLFSSSSLSTLQFLTALPSFCDF